MQYLNHICNVFAQSLPSIYIFASYLWDIYIIFISFEESDKIINGYCVKNICTSQISDYLFKMTTPPITTKTTNAHQKNF